MTDDQKPQDKKAVAEQEKPVSEINGRGGLEPTRYDDWEINGKCVDF